MLYRTSVADSWRWMRLDLVIRLIPLSLVPVLFSSLTGTPLRTFGWSLDHPIRDLLVGLPLAIAGFLVAAAFAEYMARRNRRWFVPDARDLAVQSAYYILLNAPVEEWFFRGFLQGGLSAWLRSPWLALTVSTALFGGYHFLDRWGWRPVLGASSAGLALGLIYLWQPAPASLVAPVIVHAAITCGFLSLGPYLLFSWRNGKQIARIPAERVRE
jgi:membrane protease YdiL (CAAX protease family)